MQVAFQPGRPRLSGKRARLPLPTRALPAAEMAKLRGAADSIALRLRHHDDAVHAARMPARREARGRLRRARAGARRGRRRAAHGRRRGQPARAARRGVRGRGLRPDDPQGSAADRQRPRAAGARADVGGQLAAIGRARARRCGATRSARTAEVGARRNGAHAERPGRIHPRRPQAARRARSRRGGGRGRARGERGRRGRGRAVRPAGQQRRRRRRGAERGREHARRPARADGRRGGRRRQRGHEPRTTPPRPKATIGRAARSRAARSRCADTDAVYRAYTQAVRRGGLRRGSLRRGRADAAAPAARPAAPAFAGHGLQARQPAAAAAARAADPSLGFRPGGRHARRRPARPRHRQPDAGAVLQARARHRIPRHRRLVADRQFRQHARTADHGGRDVRRHPRPHAGALRGEGRGARLHHAGLEGRPEPGALGGRWASRAIPAV